MNMSALDPRDPGVGERGLMLGGKILTRMLCMRSWDRILFNRGRLPVSNAHE